MNNNPYKTPVDHNQKNKQFSPKVRYCLTSLVLTKKKHFTSKLTTVHPPKTSSMVSKW